MAAGAEHCRCRLVHAHTTEFGIVDLTKELFDLLTSFGRKAEWPNGLGFIATSPVVVRIVVVVVANTLHGRLQQLLRYVAATLGEAYLGQVHSDGRSIAVATRFRFGARLITVITERNTMKPTI